MATDILDFAGPVTLVGGGSLDRAALAAARGRAPVTVAADGAADRLAAWGIAPDAVIGDMDSLADRARWERGPAAFRHLPEQETTDFEKCLYATRAAHYLAVGFTGGRLDHTLAVLHAMLARPEKRVVLIGEADAATLAPPGRAMDLALETGATVSLFPLLPAKGTLSEGLEWPVDGLALAPGTRSGTSNRAVAPRVRVRFDAPGVLVIVSRRHLGALIDAATAGG